MTPGSESWSLTWTKGQNPTKFLLEDGTIFTTTQGPLDYLIEHGTETPKGRIALYPHPIEGVDGLSLSLYAAINEEIQTGAISRAIKELTNDD